MEGRDDQEQEFYLRFEALFAGTALSDEQKNLLLKELLEMIFVKEKEVEL
jgi:hypothetical protein